MAMPQHKNPCPGDHEIYNFCMSFRHFYYFVLHLSDLCSGVVMKIFREIHQYFLFTLKLSPHGVGCGHEIYNILSPTYRSYIPYVYILNLVKICPVVLEKTMLTYNGREPIAIGSSKSLR